MRDLIFLSPEAAALCIGAQVVDRFAEHSTVIATLWPLPSELPWQHVQSSWDPPAPACLEPAADSTEWFQRFAKQYERSLEGHVDSASGSPPSACFGPSQRLKPVGKTQPFISHRPSRPGEVACCRDFVSAEVLRWFKQLRRLQSLLHAVRSGSDSTEACEYRWQRWQAICRAPGFRLGFVAWWPQRRIQLQGSPWCLTARVPSLPVLQTLFLDFKANFQALENWHVRRRREVLRAKHDCSLKQLFLELREPRPDQVDTLVCRREYTILESEASTKLVHIEGPLDARGISAWKLDGVNVHVDSAEAHLCRIPDALSLESGLELEQEQFLTLPEDVLAEFVSLWKPRWGKHADPASCDRARVRITHVDIGHCAFEPITAPVWRAALRRFKPRAARGPDGWAKDDLVRMNDNWLQHLLRFFHEVEAGTRSWPDQFLTGFVCALSKNNGRTDCQGYRPICLFSILYRCWSGIRARQALAFIKDVLGEGAHGFLPHRESTELWLCLEGHIELACQSERDLTGFSTDTPPSADTRYCRAHWTAMSACSALGRFS